MKYIHTQYHKTKVGEFIIGAYEGQLCLLDFRYRRMRKTVDQRIQRMLGALFVEESTPLLEATKVQLDDYLQGARTTFDLPLRLVGSDFQCKVWQALMEVPYGQTASYRDLASQIGQPTAVRAVAAANGANTLALVVPCHRIIGHDGKLVGYGGGVTVKKRLLRLESPQVSLFS